MVLRGRKGEVFNRISIHQHIDLKRMEVALNRIKTQGAVVDVDVGLNMYSLTSKVFCKVLRDGQFFSHRRCIDQGNFYLVSKLVLLCNFTTTHSHHWHR